MKKMNNPTQAIKDVIVLTYIFYTEDNNFDNLNWDTAKKMLTDAEML